MQGTCLSATCKCSEPRKGVFPFRGSGYEAEHRLSLRPRGATPMDSLLRASSRWHLELDIRKAKGACLNDERLMAFLPGGSLKSRCPVAPSALVHPASQRRFGPYPFETNEKRSLDIPIQLPYL